MRFLKAMAVCTSLSFALPSFADSLNDQPHIAVTGSAQIQVQPDQVTVNFQAINLHKDAKVAKKNVDQQVAKLLTQLKKAGFSELKFKGGVDTDYRMPLN